VTVFEHPAALAGPPIRWDELDRLLVVRPDNLGDVLLMGPAFAALRAAAPQARLDLLASPAGAQAAKLLPEIDDTVVARVSWQQIATTAEAPDTELVTEVAARGYDAAVVLTSFSQSPWPAGYALQRAGVPLRAGTSKEFGGTALTHWVPAPDDGLHQVDRALASPGPPSRRRRPCTPGCPRRAGPTPTRRWPRRASAPPMRTR
jgi:ADP-heptose:LPS heptosyltransferase